MSTKQISKLTPSSLRIILLVSIVLIIGGTAGAFWFFRNQLVELSQQVQVDNATAAASQNDIVKLQTTEKELKDNEVSITRTKKIVAESKFYQYQDQIISDLTQYAKSSGITISSFDFKAASTSQPLATTPQTTPQIPTTQALKTTDVSISIKSPFTYEAIMKFIHSIEANLTKMQLAGVSLKYNVSAGALSSDPLIIRIYTR